MGSRLRHKQVLSEDESKCHEKQQIGDPQAARGGEVWLPVDGIELRVQHGHARNEQQHSGHRRNLQMPASEQPATQASKEGRDKAHDACHKEQIRW